jgi:hypothetical protein
MSGIAPAIQKLNKAGISAGKEHLVKIFYYFQYESLNILSEDFVRR